MYYHTLNEELRRRFGCKVYKLALDGGFTCPNRDGTIGARGCIFCAGDGSGAFAADRALDIPQQIEAAKARVAGKNGGGKYIAYFQNFTNTYGSLAHMERLFTQALAPGGRCGTVGRHAAGLPAGCRDRAAAAAEHRKARLGRARPADHPSAERGLYLPRLRFAGV